MSNRSMIFIGQNTYEKIGSDCNDDNIFPAHYETLSFKVREYTPFPTHMSELRPSRKKKNPKTNNKKITPMRSQENNTFEKLWSLPN